MITRTSESVEIFFCSADEDARWQKELEKHLIVLKRQGFIHDWHEGYMLGGEEIEKEITAHLYAAHIILLLISPDFLQSSHCYELMLKALERYEAGEARVIPIYLRSAPLTKTPIANFQLLPKGGIPILPSSDLDRAFSEVAEGIQEVVLSLHRKKANELEKSPARDSSVTDVITIRQHVDIKPYYMIDTTEVINLFQKLMSSDERIQIQLLGLVGSAHMGKTHLLTKVLPHLAHVTQNAQCIVLDVRHSIHYILQLASNQFGTSFLENYLYRRKEWDREHEFIKDARERFEMRNYYLTCNFINEIRKLDNKPLYFFLDSVDGAGEDTKKWLINIFITQLLSLPHIRVVLAGRSLPEIHNSYIEAYRIYELRPILDTQAYIEYCNAIHADIVRQSIIDLAKALDYTPGTFAICIQKFVSER